jgi:iron-sulfur cluster repair protein YtfE (RIC family)
VIDAIARLIHEHHECDSQFARAEGAVQRGDWASAQRAYTEAEAALLDHFHTEESRLFPAFEAATGLVQGPTAVMREEHAAMRAILQACRTQLEAGDADGFGAELDTLFIMLQQHNVKEENVLYPLCRARVVGLDEVLAGSSTRPFVGA